ncbi:MAG: RNA polymerase sigma factor [Pirellulaceae bacterium]|nr:RNA polymerase sigma factor [Pirellulaceae bacterium]
MVRNWGENRSLLELDDPDVERMLEVGRGSATAFEQILLRYQAPVRSYLAQRLGDRDRAEDLAQEVFLRVYRARRSYAPKSRFATWLFTIVNNVAANAHRYRASRREYGRMMRQARFADDTWDVEAAEYLPGNRGFQEQPLDQLERAEAQEVVRQALRSLNRRQRTAIDLCKMQGLSYAEVAEEMNITPKAVKSLLNRAKVNLRDALQDYMEPAA